MPEKHEQKNLYLVKFPPKALNLIKTKCLNLTYPDLQKCLKKSTQNPNEGFHSKIWRKVSKDKALDVKDTVSCKTTELQHNF